MSLIGLDVTKGNVMLEELYEPLPDRDLYWKRLGLAAPGPDDPRDKELLDRIIFAHQCAIPFENLDVYDRHINVSLGIADIFNKIVRGGRGGYCFEVNAIFHALLEETGYEVMPCVGRSLKNRGYVYPFTHRGVIATVDEQRLFCDVGYGGPMPPCSIPLIDGHEISSHGQTFRIERGEGNWWRTFYLGRTEDIEAARAAGRPVREPIPVCSFLDERMQLTDYVALSHFCATSPLSVFTRQRLVNRRTEDGSVSIVDDEFTRTTPDGKEVVKIESESQLHRTLKDEFGITL